VCGGGGGGGGGGWGGGGGGGGGGGVTGTEVAVGNTGDICPTTACDTL